MKRIRLVKWFGIALCMAVCLFTSCDDLTKGASRGIFGAASRDGAAASTSTGGGTDTPVTMGSTDGLLFWNDSRLKVSNERPLFIASLYRQRFAAGSTSQYSKYDDATFTVDEKTLWEADLTPVVMWNLIPESLKPYTVLEFHFNDEGVGATKSDAMGFYDKLLSWCDSRQVPATIVVLAGGTKTITHAFNAINPDDEQDRAWLLKMCAAHPSLKGFVSTEHWWNGGESGTGVPDRSAAWLEFCAQNDKSFIIHDAGPGAIQYSQRSERFKTAMQSHGRTYLIHGFKSTGGAYLTQLTSYLVGHWMAGLSHAYGGLIDTWRWNNHGIGAPMSGQTNVKNANRDNGYSNIAQYPGGYLASELMHIYMNGGTVFNFEAPWHVYGNLGRASELLTEVIAPFFEWMTGHPTMTAAQMRASQPYWFYGTTEDLNALYKSLDVVGWAPFVKYAGQAENYNPSGQGNGTRVFKSDRYGVIPFLFQSDFASSSEAESKIRRLSGAVATRLFTGSSVDKDTWDQAYPRLVLDATHEEGRTEAFAGRRNIGGTDTWFFYNWEMRSDSNYDTTGRQTARIELAEGKFLEVSLTPYTAVIVSQEDEGRLRVYLNNYCLDTSVVWGKTSGMANRDAQYTDNLCKGGANTDSNKSKFVRDTRFYLDGCTDVAASIVKMQEYPTAGISTEGSKLLTVTSNGWLEFTVSFK